MSYLNPLFCPSEWVLKFKYWWNNWPEHYFIGEMNMKVVIDVKFEEDQKGKKLLWVKYLPIKVSGDWSLRQSGEPSEWVQVPDVTPVCYLKTQTEQLLKFSEDFKEPGTQQ